MALPFATLMAGAVGTVIYSIVGHIVGRVLLSLGFGYVTYLGIDAMLNYVEAQVLAHLGAVGGNTALVLNLLKVPDILNLYLSAFLVSFGPDIVAGFGMTRLVQGRAPE